MNKKEIIHAARTLKNCLVGGVDRITTRILKYKNDLLVEWLCSLHKI